MHLGTACYAGPAVGYSYRWNWYENRADGIYLEGPIVRDSAENVVNAVLHFGPLLYGRKPVLLYWDIFCII